MSENGSILLALARSALADAFGLCEDAAQAVPAWAEEDGATFVTLTQGTDLRGCVGSLGAYRPLVRDVQSNAVAAAFHDTRFAPLSPQELDSTRIEVSLLSAITALPAGSEDEAKQALRPRIDGVVFQWRAHRSTFLPQVWEQLPDPASFLQQLKRKAGLPADFWAPDVVISRYSVTRWKEAG
ncbi:MAG: AmmeMemoRadiSam system protein A [Betaproteobacteria bacterium]|nr:AmmeMemoRadiSam system protein A [Betaproteobacteria bacterium]